MADIRIKDLASTATTTASDDFMAVDGTTNGTRKMNAAAPAFLTSVTTPSLTSPASSPLTLAGGSSGASLVLGQGADGAVTISPAGTGDINLTAAGSGSFVYVNAANPILFINETDQSADARLWAMQSEGGLFKLRAFNDALSSAVDTFAATRTGNLLIGTTSETGLTGAGGLKINSSTAGSSNAGALVLTGGLSAGAASYFGGAVTTGGGLTASSWSLLGAGVWPTTAMGQNNSRVVSSSATENQLFTILNMNTATSGAVGINYGASIYLGARGTDNTADMAIAEIFGARESATSGNLSTYISLKTSNSIGLRTEGLRLASTGAATFAGAVTIAGTVIHTLSATPASASATGTVGTMSWDASYIYICTATNTWKRVAIATW